MARFVGKNTPIYMPDPTWANHLPMAKDAGLSLATYRCFVWRMHPGCGYRCARFFAKGSCCCRMPPHCVMHVCVRARDWVL